jgi:hypothetical protein
VSLAQEASWAQATNGCEGPFSLGVGCSAGVFEPFWTLLDVGGAQWSATQASVAHERLFVGTEDE